MRKRGKRLGVGDWNDDSSIGYVGFQSLSDRMKESVNNVSTPTARKLKRLLPRGIPNPLSAIKNFSYKSPVHSTPTLLEQDSAVVNRRGGGVTTTNLRANPKTYDERYGRNLLKAFHHSYYTDGLQPSPTDATSPKNINKSSVRGTPDERFSSRKRRRCDRRGHTGGDYSNEFERQPPSLTTTSHLKPVALCQLQDTDSSLLVDSKFGSARHLLGNILMSDQNGCREEDGNGVRAAKRMLKQNIESDKEEERHSIAATTSVSSKNSRLTKKKDNNMKYRDRIGECGGCVTNQQSCDEAKHAIVAANESQELHHHHISLLKGKAKKQHQLVYGKWSNRWKHLYSSTWENIAETSAGGNHVVKNRMINKNGSSSPQNNPGKFSMRSPSSPHRSKRRSSPTTKKDSLEIPRKGDSASQLVDLADSSDESTLVAKEQGCSGDEEEESTTTADNVVLSCSSSSLNPLPGNGLEIIVLAISLKHYVFCREMRLVLKPWERTIILTDRERQSSAADCTYGGSGRECDGYETPPLNPKAVFVRFLMEELRTFRYAYVSGDDGCIALEVKDGSESLSALLNFVRSSAEDQLASLRGNNDSDDSIAAQILVEEELALLEGEEFLKSDMGGDGGNRRNCFWLCLASAKGFDERISLSGSSSSPLGGGVSCSSSSGGVLEKNSEGAAVTTTEMMISLREKAERYIRTSSPTVDISPVPTRVASARLDFISARYFQVNSCHGGERNGLKATTLVESTGDGAADEEDGDEVVLSYPMNAGASDVIQILRSDHLRLREGEFLNDNLMDFYLKFMLREDPIIRKRVVNGGNDDTSSEVHVFTSHFFSKLSEVRLRSDNWEAVHASVSRWSKSFDMWKTRFLFIPIAEDLHWSLAVACNLNAAVERCRNKERTTDDNNNTATELLESSSSSSSVGHDAQPCIIFMDSLRMHKRRRIAGYLRAYLTQELRSIDPNALPFTDANLPCITPSVPSQSNGCDCGIFVIKYVDHILRTWPTITCQDVGTKLKNIINPYSFDGIDASMTRIKMKTELEELSIQYKVIQKNRTIAPATSKRAATEWKKR